MTKLSLFLYAADVLDSISGIFEGIGIIVSILSVFIFGFIIGSWFDNDIKNDSIAIWLRKHTIGIIVGLFVTIFGSLFASAAIPEKQTMYMIAGVEMANEFKQTETAHELSTEMKAVLHDITGIIHSYATEGAQEAK